MIASIEEDTGLEEEEQSDQDAEYLGLGAFLEDWLWSV
jgi:hypothetical protein